MRLICHGITALTALVFGVLIFFAARESFFAALELCIILGAPFLAVTLLRRVINAPRPYEIYDFYDTPPKKKQGRSFPSRHAHSVFAIGCAACFTNPTLGAILLVLGVVLCTARVLLGIHFIRDVLTGALTGTVCTLLGKFIFVFL